MGRLKDEQARREFIENRMEEYRKEAFEKLSAFIHPKCIDEMSNVLFYSWQENLPAAMKLAHFFDLRLIDFCAIARDIELFKDEYLKQEEYEIGYDQYEG